MFRTGRLHGPRPARPSGFVPDWRDLFLRIARAFGAFGGALTLRRLEDERAHVRGAARRRIGLFTTVAWFTPALLLLVAAAVFTLEVRQARVIVRWASSAPADPVLSSLGLVARRALERNGTRDTDSFLLVQAEGDALARLRQHPAVQSIEVAGGPAASVTPRIAVERVPSYAWLLDWQLQSTVLFVVAALLVGGSMADRRIVRVGAVWACLALLTAAALSLTLDPRIHMGDAEQYTASRAGFENVFADTTVGFEAHLSSRLLWWLERRLGDSATSPAAALALLARGATVWWVAMLLATAALERFSPSVLRYLALAVAAPASLMYFGYRELGYLSLTPAAFPLIVQGIRGVRGRLEAGSALAGLGAALHGFGVLSIGGILAAALAARTGGRERLWLVGRAAAFATSFYLAWTFVYVVALKLTIIPSDAGELPWRPLLDTAIRGTYVSWAVLSIPGAVEILAACWMVGVPLALAAIAAGRQTNESRSTFAYAAPSLLFLVALWPIQGLAVEADLLVAAFPAVYALAWLAAQSPRATVLGLLLLASSHVVFWRVLFSDAFVASRL